MSVKYTKEINVLFLPNDWNCCNSSEQWKSMFEPALFLIKDGRPKTMLPIYIWYSLRWHLFIFIITSLTCEMNTIQYLKFKYLYVQ